MNAFNNCSLEQELASKAGELESQRKQREAQMVDIALGAIADRVVSKDAEIMDLVAANKGLPAQALREIVIKEILRSADGLLWCREYVERQKSDQQMLVFTASHWEIVMPQQWKDFVGKCAERCGVPESHRMNQTFMKPLYEGVAFNFAAYRQQQVPDDEVWLNMRNGTLVLRKDGSVTLREHRKEDLFTYTLDYAYMAGAECELWHNFLDRVLPEKDAQQVLAEFIGYCLMKSHALEKMLWLYGEGLNGKSVTLEVIEALLGSVNVSFLSLSDLTNDDVKRAGIERKMLNISHESGKDVNANVLKQLTSGERVLVKHLYVDPYETNDYGKFIAAFNNLPRAEITFGYFRRLIILPYLVTIPADEIDRQLTVKLRKELSGILNWVLSYLPGLMNRNAFVSSGSCEKALEQYRLQSDNVRLFVCEQCEKSETTTPGTDLFEAYRKYCCESSLKNLGKKKFYERLETLGYEMVMYGNLKYYRIKLIAQ